MSQARRGSQVIVFSMDVTSGSGMGGLNSPFCYQWCQGSIMPYPKVTDIIFLSLLSSSKSSRHVAFLNYDCFPSSTIYIVVS
jgi:hypothetical protein